MQSASCEAIVDRTTDSVRKGRTSNPVSAERRRVLHRSQHHPGNQVIPENQIKDLPDDNGATSRVAAQLLFITLWELRNSITYKDTQRTSFYFGQANRVLALYLDLLDVSH